MNAKYLENRTKRQLLTRGTEFTFLRDIEDKYHQSVGADEVVTVRGIYHESNGYISVNKADSTLVQSKKTPMILALMVNVKLIAQGDYTIINDRKYKVTGVLDIQNYGVVADISLEMEV